MSRASEIEAAWRQELCGVCGHHKDLHPEDGHCVSRQGIKRRSDGKPSIAMCSCEYYVGGE